MSENKHKHTPGQMVVSSGTLIVTLEGKLVGSTLPIGVTALDVPWEEAYANAILFAKAPELLTLAEAIRDLPNKNDKLFDLGCANIRTAARNILTSIKKSNASI